MMKRMYRAFACLLTVLFLFAGVILPSAAFASVQTQTSKQLTDQKGGTVSYGSNSIVFFKKIEPTGIENYFDITLQVVEEEIVEESSVDVVIVLDISNTMNTTHEGKVAGDTGYKASDARIADAKAAASEFVTQYRTATNLSSVRNLGLVTFNSDANIVIDLQPVNRSMPGTIESIIAPTGDRRFTNIEGGLRLAQSMLNNSSSQYQFVILITDGFPTTYTEKVASGGRTMQGYDTYDPNSKVFRDRVQNKPVSYGCDYSEKAAVEARKRAVQMKNSGINIMSVGVDVGVNTIQGYLDAHKGKAFSTVDRYVGNTSTFEIGGLNDKNGYVNWLTNSIAGGPDLSAGQRYRNGSRDKNNQSQLGTAFADLLSVVQAKTGRAMGDAGVNDPMGANAEFIGFYNKSGKLLGKTASLTGSRTLNAENTAAYTGSASADAINWDLSKSGYTTVSKTVNNTAVLQYTHTIRYRVRLTNEISGFRTADSHPANDDATLVWDDPSTPQDDQHKLVAPDPAVKGYLGQLSFTKMGETPENGAKVLEGARFVLSHASNCSVCAAAQNKVSITDKTAVSNVQGKVSFTSIPSGHDYVLTETTVPQNYIPAQSVNVSVAYGVTTSGLPAGGQLLNKRIQPARLEVSGQKSVQGSGLDRSGWTFELSDAQNNIIASETSDASGAFSFVIPPLPAVGSYEYSVREKAPENPGSQSYVYDPTVYTIHVDVTSVNQQFQTSTTITNTTTGQTVTSNNTSVSLSGLNFENRTRIPASVPLKVQKNLDGRSMIPGEFTFELKNGNQVLQTAQNDAYGVVAFEPLTFDTLGTYTYTIAEKGQTTQSADHPYMAYDPAVYTVQVTVDPAGTFSGPFTVSVAYSKDGQPYTYSDTNPILFENTWVDAGKANFSFTKNAWVDQNTFTPLEGVSFTLTHDKEHGCVETGIGPFTANSDENGSVHFTGIPSGHSYVLEETEDVTVEGITYQKILPRRVVVSYGVAYIDGVPANQTSPVTITNYPAKQARVEFQAIKQLYDEQKNQIPVPDQVFSFKLEQVDANGEPVQNGYSEIKRSVDEYPGSLNDTVTFTPIYFSGEGVYYYRLTELHLTSDDRVIYDQTVYLAEVTVEKDAADKLEANLKWMDHNWQELNSSVVFVNRLRKPASAVLQASKVLRNTREPALRDEFTFELLDEQGNVLQTRKNGDNGIVEFSPISYQASGEYKYRIREMIEAKPHVIYDTAVHEVTVTVTPDDNAESYVTSVVYGDTGRNHPVFLNSYSASLVLIKTHADGKAMGGAEFSLIHNESCCQASVPTMKAVSRGTDGHVVFSSIPSGHIWLLRETVVPAEHAAAPDHRVEVQRGIATVYEIGSSTPVPENPDPHRIVNHPEARIVFSGQKSLYGRPWTDQDAFEMELLDENFRPLQKQRAQKDTGAFSFSMVYDETAVSGTKVYYVHEVVPAGDLAGVVYDPACYRIAVKVEKDADHKVTAAILSAEKGRLNSGVFAVESQETVSASGMEFEGLHFSNAYGTRPVTEELGGRKILNGRSMLEGEFVFAVYPVAYDAAGGAFVKSELPVKVASNKADGTFHFADRTYYTPGVYLYTIEEIYTGMPGVTYDSTVYHLAITVEDDGKGSLVSAKRLADGFRYEGGQTVLVNPRLLPHDRALPDITFDNAYTINGKGQALINGRKELAGRNLQDGEFAFALYEADANFRESAMKEAAFNRTDGSFAFAPLTYDRAGTWYYVVKEMNTGLKGVAYDTAVYHVTVTVQDSLQGSWHVQTSVARADGQPADELVFVNHYQPPIPQTGDHSSLLLWMALALISAAGAVVLLKRKA